MDAAMGINLPSSVMETKENSFGTVMRRRRRRVIIIVVASTALFLAISGAMITLIWFALRPHEPYFVVRSLHLSNLSTSTLSDHTQLQSNSSNTLLIDIVNINTNTNMDIDHPFNVSVCNNDIQLYMATVPGSIYFEGMERKAVKAEFGEVAENPFLLPDPDTDDFNVKMSVRMRFKALDQLLTWPRYFDVHCPIRVTYHDTSQVRGSGFCDVVLLPVH